MACHTQEEIAEREDVDQKTITNQISGVLADLPEFLKSHPAANHLTDFEPPIYNVWKQWSENSDRYPTSTTSTTTCRPSKRS
jgi:hypothetical protein